MGFFSRNYTDWVFDLMRELDEVREVVSDPTVVYKVSIGTNNADHKCCEKHGDGNTCHCKTPEIERVIFNDPATVIFWKDGTKTVAKCGRDDTYDREKGFMVAYLKKTLGSTKLKNMMARWTEE